MTKDERIKHLERALRKILKVCTTETAAESDNTPVDDLCQCANFADQGLKGEKLIGEPNL